MTQGTVDKLWAILALAREAKLKADELPEVNRLPFIPLCLAVLLHVIEEQIHVADQQLHLERKLQGELLPT